MESLLQRNLIVVTGKGGVGKSTIAGAIGLLASQHRHRTLVVDLTGASRRLPQLFAAQNRGELQRGEVHRLADRLHCLSIDPDAALLQWIQSLGGRVPGRILAAKASFQYFAAAAPGAKELVCLIEVCKLASGREGRHYDLVVLDAPATGHALAMLASPRTFASIAKVGPVADQAERVRQLLEDQRRTGYLAVSQASEMAVSETIQLQRELALQLGVSLSSVIVNATLRRRFTGEEMQRIESLKGEGDVTPQSRVAHAAAAAAAAAHARTRFQHNQVARLRRQGLTVLQVPFVFQADLDLHALRRIAAQLNGRI